jgi:REP element-mobilizing transposase RayT
MIPAATYPKHPLFQSRDRLDFLLTHFQRPTTEHGISVQAWAIFPNHYHFVGFSNPPEKLHSFLWHFHSVTAAEVNRLDRSPARKVWFQFWDSHLTYQNRIPLDFGTFTTTPFATNLPVLRRTIRGVRRAGFNAKLQRHSARRSSVLHAINCACPTISM